MKVCVTPIPEMSIAMERVAMSLRRYAPKGVEFTPLPWDADFQVLHAIGPDSVRNVKTYEFVTIQYCLWTANSAELWKNTWGKSKLVVSYYDLTKLLPEETEFLYLPLGVDRAVFNPGDTPVVRNIGILSSGYVTGPAAEAIEEVAEAALRTRNTVYHLGPQKIENMGPRKEISWVARGDEVISDSQLVDLYRHSRWVSGLRHGEGFELPVLEGLACGARPIVFDREDMRHWYDGHAVFVPECDGEKLVDHLVQVLSTDPEPITAVEREEIFARFDWKPIAERFWKEALR